MEFDRKTVLAFALIGLLLILVNTDFYQKLMLGDIAKRPVADSTAIKQPDIAPPLPETKTFELAANADTAAAINFSKERTQEKEIRIETPLYTGTFSTLGASLKSWQFKKYSDHNGNPVSLFSDGADNLVVQLATTNDSLNTGQLNFAVDYQFGANLTLQAGDKRELVFTKYLADGKFIRKTYSFSGDEYAIRLKIEFVNLQDILERSEYALSWHTGLASTEPRPDEEMNYAHVFSLANKELDEFDVGSEPYKNNDSKHFWPDSWPAQWVAVRNKYFTVAIMPQGLPAKGVRYDGRATKLDNKVIHKAYQLDIAMPLERGANFSHEFIVYIGPLDYKTVKSFGVDLEKMMSLAFGWSWVRSIIQPISILILWTFGFLHSLIPNYGIVIFVFSILVKIVLHPLTKKSYQSMQGMQKIQPEMTRLREKYASDPQKMNLEMMKLYKEHGVNPMSGCLPLVLQMPLMYALFTIFRTTLELRQSPFFGWIKDLSAPDTILHLPITLPLYGNSFNVLPLLMGVTMLIQQAMTNKDPKQKAMVYMMPVIMTLAFNSFPSGLNLYYTLFNVWSILQQKYMPNKEPVKKEKKKSYKQFVGDFRKHGMNSLLSKRRLR